MTAEQLASLSPSKPLGTYVPYEHVEFLASTPPKNVGDREDSAIAIELWFHELREWKLSRDGCGSVWPKSSSAWVPRDKFDEEDLYNSSRKPPSVSYQLFRAYSNYGHPHQVYHAWHGDEGREGVILRSEVQILISCMAGRMSDPALCVHKVPVLLHSIHGNKARIMIAHVNLDTRTLDIKCSKFEQFDGFETRDNEEGSNGRKRPHDFEAKRDLFFRWLNPTCQGETFLKDSKDAREFVRRESGGRKRLVPRVMPPGSLSSKLSETLE